MSYPVGTNTGPSGGFAIGPSPRVRPRSTAPSWRRRRGSSVRVLYSTTLPATSMSKLVTGRGRPRHDGAGRSERRRPSELDVLAGLQNQAGGVSLVLDPARERRGVLLQQGEGVVVDRDHALRRQQPHRFQRVLGAHGEVVADRQQSDVQSQ